MADHSELKALRSKRKRIDSQLCESKAELLRLESEADKFKYAIAIQAQELKDVDAQLDELAKQPIVTEHAILRYLERVEGLDIEAIKRKILPEETAKRVSEFPDGTFQIGNGFVAIVRNRQVVTIEKNGGKHERRSPRDFREEV